MKSDLAAFRGDGGERKITEERSVEPKTGENERRRASASQGTEGTCLLPVTI